LRTLGHEVDTAAWTAPERVIEPDPDRVEFYAEGYARYRARVSAARAEWGGSRVAG
jgi:hypothetical protein